MLAKRRADVRSPQSRNVCAAVPPNPFRANARLATTLQFMMSQRRIMIIQLFCVICDVLAG